MRTKELTPAQKRFDKLLIDKGIRTHRSFADSVGIDETLFSGVYNGYREFPAKHLSNAADALGENIDFVRGLLRFSENNKLYAG